MFGALIRNLRIARRIGLREFSQQIGHDPSNWSKIEREAVRPPTNPETLGKLALVLGIEEDSFDWKRIHDYADVDAGKIPDYVCNDKQLVAKLPVFFRTVSGKKPSREQLLELARMLGTTS